MYLVKERRKGNKNIAKKSDTQYNISRNGYFNEDITNSVIAADKRAQYDESAKKLLAHKHILAHILVNTVDEFKGMNPNDAVTYIEGEPLINVVPTEPGMTNHSSGDKIVGFNSENLEINEGMIRFDIVFYVRMRDGLSQMIINVEAQKDNPTSYRILNRAIFYVCRLVSSQKERDFVNTNYDDIKRVVSIWICMNMEENSLDCYQLENTKMLGNHNWEGKQDMISIVLIGLSKSLPESDEKYELHRLLGALLSSGLENSEKINILNKEYDIPISREMREDVSTMCNLGLGVEEKGYEKGYAGAKTDFILKMYKSGMNVEQIAEIISTTVDDVKQIIEENVILS